MVPAAAVLAAVYGGGAPAREAADAPAENGEGGGGGAAFLKLLVVVDEDDGARAKPAPWLGGTSPLPCREVWTRRAVDTMRLLICRLSIESRASL